MKENIYYNYVYLDPCKPGDYNYNSLHFDFEPFYIGKGYGNRCYKHLNEKEETTCNPHKVRKINKIKKQGLEPIILKIYENLDEKTAYYNEIELISLIGKKNDNKGTLVNITNGGDGNDTNCKIVYQYDINCIFIKKWKSQKLAADTTLINNINNCCNLQQLTSGGFIWSYNKLNNFEIEKILNSIKYKRNKTYKKVYQNTIDGNIFNKEFISIKKAENDTGTHSQNIISCCKNYRLHTNGSIWSYHQLTKNEVENRINIIINNNDNIKKNKNISKCKNILQYDFNNNLIKEYKSITDAYNETGINHISLCCRGKSKTAGGFIWKYKENIS